MAACGSQCYHIILSRVSMRLRGWGVLISCWCAWGAVSVLGARPARMWRSLQSRHFLALVQLPARDIIWQSWLHTNNTRTTTWPDRFGTDREGWNDAKILKRPDNYTVNYQTRWHSVIKYSDNIYQRGKQVFFFNKNKGKVNMWSALEILQDF